MTSHYTNVETKQSEVKRAMSKQPESVSTRTRSQACLNSILDLTCYKVQRGGKRQNNFKNINYNQWSGSI